MSRLQYSFFNKKTLFVPCCCCLISLVLSSPVGGTKNIFDSSIENFDEEPPSQNLVATNNKTKTFHEQLIATWTKSSRERLAGAESRDSIWTAQTPQPSSSNDNQKSAPPQNNSSFSLSDDAEDDDSSAAESVILSSVEKQLSQNERKQFGQKIASNPTLGESGKKEKLKIHQKYSQLHDEPIQQQYEDDPRLSHFYSTLPDANVDPSIPKPPPSDFLTSLTPPIVFRPNPYPMMKTMTPEVNVNGNFTQPAPTRLPLSSSILQAASSTSFSYLGNPDGLSIKSSMKKSNSKPAAATDNDSDSSNKYEDTAAGDDERDDNNYGNDGSTFPEEIQMSPTTVDEGDYDNEDDGGRRLSGDDEENGGDWEEEKEVGEQEVPSQKNVRRQRRKRPMIKVYMNKMRDRAHTICSLYFGRGGRLCRNQF